MSTFLELFNFVLLVIVTFTGMVGNGFIAIVNFIDWFRSRKLSPADMILSCLSLFRFAFLAIVMQTAILLLFFKDALQKRNVFIPLHVSWLFVNTADIWFATWLSVLYCVKNANFSQPLFLKMKRRFPGLIPWLLLGTVVFSAIVSIVTGGITVISKCRLFESHLSNNSNSGNVMSDFCEYLIHLYIVPDFFSIAVFLSSSILVITSLWRHKNLLQNNARDVSTDVHLNAIKALASLSILYVSSFCVEVLDVVLVWVDTKDDWVTIIVFNLIAAYSSGHAVILIFVNPKLKQESIKMLHQLQC